MIVKMDWMRNLLCKSELVQTDSAGTILIQQILTTKNSHKQPKIRPTNTRELEMLLQNILNPTSTQEFKVV
jgi:hypothetical protein